MSKHSVPAGEVSGLLRRFAELRREAAARTGRDFPIIVIQEVGLDGFWIHRVLQSEGIASHVVDAASIPTSRPVTGPGARQKTLRGPLVRERPPRLVGDLAGGQAPGPLTAINFLAEIIKRTCGSVPSDWEV